MFVGAESLGRRLSLHDPAALLNTTRSLARSITRSLTRFMTRYTTFSSTRSPAGGGGAVKRCWKMQVPAWTSFLSEESNTT